MRSSMGQDRLTDLALLNIHYDMELELDDVIDIFSRKHLRRMMLATIFSNATSRLPPFLALITLHNIPSGLLI